MSLETRLERYAATLRRGGLRYGVKALLAFHGEVRTFPRGKFFGFIVPTGKHIPKCSDPLCLGCDCGDEDCQQCYYRLAGTEGAASAPAAVELLRRERDREQVARIHCEHYGAERLRLYTEPRLWLLISPLGFPLAASEDDGEDKPDWFDRYRDAGVPMLEEDG